MKAWWAYWLTLAFGAVLWIGLAVVAGREGIESALGQPIWATILIAPIFLAGLNLVAFRRTHEVVCRLCVHRLPRGGSVRGLGAVPDPVAGRLNGNPIQLCISADARYAWSG